MADTKGVLTRPAAIVLSTILLLGAAAAVGWKARDFIAEAKAVPAVPAVAAQAAAPAVPIGIATAEDLRQVEKSLSRRLGKLERRFYLDMVLVKTKLGIKVEAESISAGDGE
jgi:hypothetical protein